MNIKEEKFATDFHFATPEDEAAGIETAIYLNGNQVKKFTISTGKNVIVRELNGKDMLDIDQMASNQADYIPMMLHKAVKIEGEHIPMEDFLLLKGKDFNKIKVQAIAINF